MPTPLKFTLAFLILVGGLIYVLAFGNPQWHKQIYMFQAYTLNFGRHPIVSCDCRIPFRRLDNPKNYDGTWFSYCPDGHVAEMMVYDSGRLIHGQTARLISYSSNTGTIQIQRRFTMTGEIDKQTIIYDDGTPEIVIFDELAHLDRRAEFGIPIE